MRHRFTQFRNAHGLLSRTDRGDDSACGNKASGTGPVHGIKDCEWKDGDTGR